MDSICVAFGKILVGIFYEQASVEKMMAQLQVTKSSVLQKCKRGASDIN